MRRKAPTERIGLAKPQRMLDNRFVLAWQEEGGDAWASASAEYRIAPGPALGKLSLPIVYRMNEREAMRTLANLMARGTM